MSEAFPTYESFLMTGSNLAVTFSDILSQEDQDAAADMVNGFVDYETVEQLEIYLDQAVFPFIKSLINKFAAENIAMGITQYGKTDEVLGLFSKNYPVNVNFPISLKSCFDTGSLYCAITVIEYVRENEDMSSVSPFVTDARLVALKNKIEQFLGMPPTE